MKIYCIDEIEACEPEGLTVVDGVQVTLNFESGMFPHGPAVTIKATSEAKLLKYFLTSWGEDDEWVQERIDSITVEESTDEFVSGVFTHEWTADESDLVLTPFPSPAYLIESEWYYVTKGEIDLREDTALRTLALSMFTAARDSVDNDASSQVDMAGNEIDVVTDREIAQRVCRSLSTMYWGW